MITNDSHNFFLYLQEKNFYSCEEIFFYKSVHVFIDFFFICEKINYHRSVPEWSTYFVKKIRKNTLIFLIFFMVFIMLVFTIEIDLK